MAVTTNTTADVNGVSSISEDSGNNKLYFMLTLKDLFWGDDGNQ